MKRLHAMVVVQTRFEHLAPGRDDRHDQLRGTGGRACPRRGDDGPLLELAAAKEWPRRCERRADVAVKLAAVFYDECDLRSSDESMAGRIVHRQRGSHDVVRSTPQRDLVGHQHVRLVRHDQPSATHQNVGAHVG